jgi:hypothetical protein
MSPLALYGLAGAVLGVAVLGSSSSAPAAAQAPQLPSPSPGGGGGAAAPALPSGQIMAAVAVALRTETDPSNLTSFASALSTLGYGAAAAKLQAKAGTLGAPGAADGADGDDLGSVNTGPPGPDGAPTPVAVNFVPPGATALASGYVMGKSGEGLGRIDGSGNFVPTGGGQAIGKGGAPVAGTSEFGQSGLDPSDPNDLPYWVNLYAHAGLTTGQTPSSAQVAAAVKAALASVNKSAGKNVADFYNVLLSYPQYAGLAETLHSAAVLPFYVKAYSGSDRWSPTEIITAALKAQGGGQLLYADTDKGLVPSKGLAGYPLSQENLAYSMLAFANALWASRAFGRNWEPQAQGLAGGASQMFLAAGLTEAAEAIFAETPGQWTT